MAVIKLTPNKAIKQFKKFGMTRKEALKDIEGNIMLAMLNVDASKTKKERKKAEKNLSELFKFEEDVKKQWKTKKGNMVQKLRKVM